MCPRAICEGQVDFNEIKNLSEDFFDNIWLFQQGVLHSQTTSIHVKAGLCERSLVWYY